MYHLRLFDVDCRGRPIGLVVLGRAYGCAVDAITEADQLRLGTHFRITDEGGHLILEDRLPELRAAQVEG